MHILFGIFLDKIMKKVGVKKGFSSEKFEYTWHHQYRNRKINDDLGPGLIIS